MTRIEKSFAAGHPVAAWRIRSRVDNVPFPPREMLNYVLEQDTLDFKNLALHIVTTMIVADTIITAIDKQNQQLASDKRIAVDKDTTLETLIAHHAVRPLGEAGMRGEATPFINEYMKTHKYTDFAVMVAVQSRLPLAVIQSMEEIEGEGFPKKTIGPENSQRMGTIDWTTAINQIATWSVAGTIISIDKRFEDLISRHVGNVNSPYKFTREDWLDMRDWGKERIQEFCHHLGIEPQNFHEWLRSEIQYNLLPEEAKIESDNLIKELFHREPGGDEFLPISPAYRYLARSILRIEPSNTEVRNGVTVVIPNPQRKVVERLLAKPERFLQLCQVYGLVQKENDDYKSV